jgi:hypothetical protein
MAPRLLGKGGNSIFLNKFTMYLVELSSELSRQSAAGGKYRGPQYRRWMGQIEGFVVTIHLQKGGVMRGADPCLVIRRPTQRRRTPNESKLQYHRVSTNLKNVTTAHAVPHFRQLAILKIRQNLIPPSMECRTSSQQSGSSSAEIFNDPIDSHVVRLIRLTGAIGRGYSGLLLHLKT